MLFRVIPLRLDQSNFRVFHYLPHPLVDMLGPAVLGYYPGQMDHMVEVRTCAGEPPGLVPPAPLMSHQAGFHRQVVEPGRATRPEISLQVEIGPHDDALMLDKGGSLADRDTVPKRVILWEPVPGDTVP